MSLQNRRESKGRNPLLKVGSLASRIFIALREKPDMSLRKIATTLMEEYQIVNGMVQRMKGAGLVIRVPVQIGSRQVWGYRAVIENETGHARDRVRFEVTIYVNEFGEYSASAKVVGQSPTAIEDNPHPIHKGEFYTVVPKPNEPLKTRDVFGPRAGENKNAQPLTIEGEIVDISSD